ncbi:DNA ligase 2 [Kineosporia sp. NBRC 101677]|uniref:NAD-dependent DNA ligase LigA n=1 Tax=Kineosporia sp. NBRC 101677 TaxID=3032197 RepID=UPI0024A0E4BB|nr:NAD-dependent DNA ligase LigA [Kineosporia sp. NBRC 101677]GLY16743.1 DNA ligase 2 [Kineosporia sp. NBRC 101677]
MSDTAIGAGTVLGRDEYLQAVETVRAAAGVYYATTEVAADAPSGAGVTVLDDATYDQLVRDIAATEAAHPQWQVENSPTQVVAGAAGDVEHTVPMLSLDNVFSAADLLEWHAGLAKRLGHEPRYVVEPKLDGLALAARYENGSLVQIITRGDGLHGEDVTFAVAAIVGLPATLARPLTLEVRGEVMLTDTQFEAANELRLANGDKAFVNPRNGVAGALRGSRDRTYIIPMTFFAYQVLPLPDTYSGPKPDADIAYSAAIELLGELGVHTAATTRAGIAVVDTLPQAQEYIDALLAARADLGFGIDGAVIKADAYADREAAGSSSRAPRWGTAYKYPSDSRLTTLEEVIWQVGRTGVITPRGRVAPVFVGGVTVSYATLHNPNDLARQGLMIGDTVMVLRAGEVIPRIEGFVAAARTGNETEIEVPQVCPNCGGEIDRSQERWRCKQGRICALPQAVRYAVARDCWDIESVGEKLVRQLVDTGLVTDVADLFTLTQEQLLELDRIGEASATKVLSEIEGAKAKPLARTLTALGVRGTGRSMSRRIARWFGTMEAIQAATAAEFEEVDGIGPEKAPVIVEELAELAPVVQKLREAGVNMTEPGLSGREAAARAAESSAEAAALLPLTGENGKPMTVVVTGKMTGPLAELSRNEMNELIERAGGKSSGSVSKTTGLLVASESGSSKYTKAEALGITIETPDEFAERVADFLALDE